MIKTCSRQPRLYSSLVKPDENGSAIAEAEIEPTLTIDQELTKLVIRSFSDARHRSHAKCSPNGPKADSIVLVERSKRKMSV